MDLSSSLRAWYQRSARDLPWRRTSDPYAVWLSEIILQQTRVAQGLPYFEAFMQRFPTVNDLAHADENDVMKMWEGLGYYSRARNLHKGATYIDQHGFPESYKDWLNVPGVGPYTAAAVSSFVLGEEKAVVDGNVNRVIARLTGFDGPVNATEGVRFIQSKAEELIYGQPPAEHNQAIMELGALVCTPKSPSCNVCPWKDFCKAHELGIEERLPVKTRKTKVKEVDLHYTAIFGSEGVYLNKRDDSGIWKSLYEFIPMKASEFAHHKELRLSGTRWKLEHLLSHRKLSIYIRSAEWTGKMPPSLEGYPLLSWTNCKEIALPKPLRQWLDNNLLPLRLDSEH